MGALIAPGDRRLRLASSPVRFPDPTLDGLVAELMRAVTDERALAIAAPQIGTNRQVAVIRQDEHFLVLVNPRMVETTGSQTGWEGCLSIPDRVGWVKRPKVVVVESCDQRGRPQRYRATGLAARAVAHEIDHLAGKLYVDGLDPELIVDTRRHPTPPSMPGRLTDARAEGDGRGGQI